MKNLNPTVSIVAGVLIFVWPAAAVKIVGIYLIVSGILALTGKK